MFPERLGMIRHADRGSAIAAGLLLVILVLGPLLFGGVLPRERLVLTVAANLALIVLLLSRRDPRILKVAARPALALAAVGFYGLLQSLPWPRFLVVALAPRMAEVWEHGGALLRAESPPAVPMSLAPTVSRETALLWLSLAACLLVATELGKSRPWRRVLALTLFAVAAFEIAYGADNWFRGANQIWGIEVLGDPSRLRGTFVNPNHFAFFMALPICVCFAWLWWGMRRARYVEQIEHRLLYLTLPGLIFLMFFVGLAFSGSRGGLISALLALAFQTFLLTLLYRRWQMALLGLATMALGLGGIAFFGLQQGLGRFLETSAYEVAWNDRLRVYAASFDLWRDFPWTGTGLGTFRQAFPMVQPADLEKTWSHAHSDLLELLITTGLIGWPIMLWGLFHLVRRLWIVVQDGRRSEDRAMALAALGSLVASLAHSVIDFGLTMPANAFALTLLCGLGCGAPVEPRLENELTRRAPSQERASHPPPEL